MEIIRKRILNKFLLAILAITSACSESGKIIETFPVPIYQVNEIQLSIPSDSPTQLNISANGLTGSAGWSNPVLLPRFIDQAPSDGIYEFDFMAVPPEEASATVLTPIETDYLFDPMPADLIGVRILAEQNSKMQLLEDNAEPVAYFEFRGTNDTDRFVIKLIDPDKIQHARDLLAGLTTTEPSVMGTIIKNQASFNPHWSYYLDPQSIEFFDSAIEVCDASMQYIEEHLDEVGDMLLPNNVWCPWDSKLTKEL